MGKERMWIMVKQIEISNFKCFKNITIDNVSPITIIGGQNNAGKSALLEAVMLNNSAGNPGIFWALGNLRNIILPNPTPNQIWEPLFYKMKDTNEFTISVKDYTEKISSMTISKIYNHTEKNQHIEQPYEIRNITHDFSAVHITISNGEYSLKGKYVVQKNMLQNYTIQFVNDSDNSGNLEELAKYFSKYVFYRNLFDNGTGERLSQITLDIKKKNLLVKTLKVFDESICDITTVLYNGTPYIYVVTNSGYAAPINYMGDGIIKAVHILLYVLDLEDGILFIDEIENGFYYDLYEKLLKIFFETALIMNCQIIMTTHNRDIVESALTVMEKLNKVDDICYQRLDKDKQGNIVAHSFQGKNLKIPFDLNMEIR